MIPAKPYQPKNKIRIVTATSLFDGHDAAINIMRRIMQRSGAEIIHLGHNRSVDEIVNTAIQEDVQGIAITSYQGGTMSISVICTICSKSVGAAISRFLVVAEGLCFRLRSLSYTITVLQGYTLQMMADIWVSKG